MDYQKVLQEIRRNFEQKKLFFTDEDHKFNTSRNYWQGMIHGVFTRAYHKRKDLFIRGHIIYGMSIKSYLTGDAPNHDYSTWVIFSPQIAFEENPLKYYEIADKLNAFLDRKPNNATEQRLKMILEGELSEPQYFELPSDLTNGSLVFLSGCFVRTRHSPSFRLGINLIIIEKTVSKEIVYLPERYFSEDYKKYYQEKIK